MMAFFRERFFGLTSALATPDARAAVRLLPAAAQAVVRRRFRREVDSVSVLFVIATGWR